MARSIAALTTSHSASVDPAFGVSDLARSRAAASSLTNAFQEIGKEYEKARPGTRVLFNFGASGQLLQQISRMNVSQRVQFAMKGSGEARRALIRDSNKVVQRAVLQSPRLTDQEVEAYASMSNLTDEILRLIATNRNFRKNYAVVRNLMNNPKTPLDVTLHMLPMLNVLDLKKLTTNKNVPETLRSTALKLQKTRADLKK